MTVSVALVPWSVILVTAATLAAPAARADDPPVPNILLIVLDDVGVDQLGLYSSSPCSTPSTCLPSPNPTCPASSTDCPPCGYARTPNIDRLAAEGILFTNAYGSPFCSPARACIQTGRHSFRTGLGDAIKPAVPGFLQDAEVLIPELLHHGFAASAPGLPYACGAFGKWHLSISSNGSDCVATCEVSDEPGHDDHAVQNGYDHFFGSIDNQRTGFCWTRILHDGASSLGCLQVNGAVSGFNSTTWQPSVVIDDGDLNTLDDAATWIDSQTATSFFAYVAPNPPHANLRVPPLDLVARDTACTLTDCSLYSGYAPPTSSCGPYSADDLKRLIYRANLEAVDTVIGKLLADMNEETLANTLIIIAGDNGTPGGLINSPYTASQGKGTIYEGGIRIPLIVSGPLVDEPGRTSTQLVHLVDLWPTIAEFTGADPETAFDSLLGSDEQSWPTMDGVSFAGIISGASASSERTFVFSEWFTPLSLLQGPPPLCTQKHERAYIKRRTADQKYWKLIRRRLTDACYVGPEYAPCAQSCGIVPDEEYTEQLFCLTDDPYETDDYLVHVNNDIPTAFLIALRNEMIGLSGD